MLVHLLLFLIELVIIILSLPMALTPALNRSIFNPVLYQRIQDIWFAGLPPEAKGVTEEAARNWFRGTPEEKLAFDDLLRKEFAHALEAVSPKNYPILTNEPNSRPAAPFIDDIHLAANDAEKTSRTLSLILLFDQIPRNLYRTTETLPLVYNHYDHIALGITQHMLTMNPRPDLHPSVFSSPSRRLWFYLPLWHSEDHENHKVGKKIYDDMRAEAQALAQTDPSAKDAVELLELSEKPQQMHYDLIEKFGRYPHRNRCLGREGTKKEIEYLESGGETFGVTG